MRLLTLSPTRYAPHPWLGAGGDTSGGGGHVSTPPSFSELIDDSQVDGELIDDNRTDFMIIED